jgi:glycosyltransferase involved in cell wall biosynthesis
VNRVSVVMSVYNGADFLPAAIDSVLSQTFQDFEFIIVDDGSTDRSVEIIGSYNDPRIVLVRQKNQGVAAALNHGLKRTTGEYIARQDADDISLRERFARQVQYLDAHPEVAVLGTAALIIDAHDRPFSKFLPFAHHKRLVAELLRGVCPLMHGSVMVRRQAILTAGGYKPIFSHAQDVELWLRMSAQYRLANLREVLYHYRKHDRSITQQAHVDLLIKAFAEAGKFSTDTSAQEWVRFAEAFDRDFAGSRWERAFEAENRLKRAQIGFAQGNLSYGIRYLAGAIRLNPQLLADLPARILRRLWRTLFPIIG